MCLQIPKYLIKMLDNFVCKRVCFMSMLLMLRSRPVFLFFVIFSCVGLGAADRAQADPISAQQISGAISMAVKEEIQSYEALNKGLVDGLDRAVEDIKANRILIENAQRLRDAGVAPDDRLLKSLAAAAVGIAGTEIAVRDILQNRLNELNLVRSNTMEPLAPYLVDPTLGSLTTNAQIFEIFMRFFCDPRGRNGTLANVQIETTRYTLGCGAVLSGGGGTTAPAIDTNVLSRDGLFGRTPTGENARMRDQLVNLPLRPEAMFFHPETFPVGQAAGHTNTNELAPVYYGAFSQAMHFLVGPPPDVPNVAEMGDPARQADYINTQAVIARQMMATYPFALLFGERVGMMGTEAAQQIAGVLLERLGNAASDPYLFQRVQEIEARSTISIAEYMDILMYRMPLSPGYLNYISSLTPAQARREEVWLTALQTAVNYQRNRWLEIQAALEAIQQK